MTNTPCYAAEEKENTHAQAEDHAGNAAKDSAGSKENAQVLSLPQTNAI